MTVLTAASGSAPEQSDDATEAAGGDEEPPATALEGQTISKRPGFLGDGTILSWVSSLFRRNGHRSDGGSHRE